MQWWTLILCSSRCFSCPKKPSSFWQKSIKCSHLAEGKSEAAWWSDSQYDRNPFNNLVRQSTTLGWNPACVSSDYRANSCGPCFNVVEPLDELWKHRSVQNRPCCSLWTQTKRHFYDIKIWQYQMKPDCDVKSFCSGLLTRTSVFGSQNTELTTPPWNNAGRSETQTELRLARTCDHTTGNASFYELYIITDDSSGQKCSVTAFTAAPKHVTEGPCNQRSAETVQRPRHPFCFWPIPQRWFAHSSAGAPCGHPCSAAIALSPFWQASGSN